MAGTSHRRNANILEVALNSYEFFNMPDISGTEGERCMKKKVRAAVCFFVFFLLTVRSEAADKRKIAIDPGHQGSWVDMSAQEAMAPDSSETKAKATAGTEGRFSGVAEYELNLRIALALKSELVSRGYEVVMTRENNDTAISNQERAKLANDSGAEVCVRIHANGSDDSSVSGALAMAPSEQNPYVGNLSAESTRLSQCVLDSYCERTGLSNDGVIYTDDMTGINFSKIPVTILEMGYMSNESDDLYMTSEANENDMAQGIADGLDLYFSETVRSTEKLGTTNTGMDFSFLEKELNQLWLNELAAAGEHWAVEVMDLNSGSTMKLQAEDSMQSASVIKIFIMGAVYERAVYAAESGKELIPMQETYDGELKDLLAAMITVSDNNAANELVTRLGQGDFEAGTAVVNEFCEEHGFKTTHLGRRFLAENPTDDNYTSAADCTSFLSSLYNGTLLNVEASRKMLELLEGQTVKEKIPAGLPSYVETANKTGEMPSGYGLGSIENDVAIVMNGRYPYILCVLSNNIADNGNAQSVIREISEKTYLFFSDVTRS